MATMVSAVWIVGVSVLHRGLYPKKAVTINLAPANVRKEGVGFDLPMAIGILGAMGLAKAADQHLLVGELSLDGTLRPVRGVLSIAVYARQRGIVNIVVPADNAAEAGATEGVRVFGMRHLAEVVSYLREPEHFQPFAPVPRIAMAADELVPDFRDVWGQATAKRALEVAAAGGHNVLTSGPFLGSFRYARILLTLGPAQGHFHTRFRW